MDELKFFFRYVASAKVFCTLFFTFFALLSQSTRETEAGTKATPRVEIVSGTPTTTTPWMPLLTCALNPDLLQKQMSQCTALASQPTVTPVYTLHLPVQSPAHLRSSSLSQQSEASETCKAEPSFSPLLYPSPAQWLLVPMTLPPAALHLRDQLRSIFSARPSSSSSSSSELLFCAMSSDLEGDVSDDKINVLGLARTVAGSGGVWEMVEVVEEEEIEMEDGYEEEEEEKEARGIWMVLLFLALLVIVWTESDEVHLHQ
ncbi:MAG: hypothetical protein JOS17DRAFT_817005 [Linnemannia elongata]|nr:MAG: hypothetical protein JOS17DRAFT_817005 [Linnemannia elongata]